MLLFGEEKVGKGACLVYMYSIIDGSDGGVSIKTKGKRRNVLEKVECTSFVRRDERRGCRDEFYFWERREMVTVWRDRYRCVHS